MFKILLAVEHVSTGFETDLDGTIGCCKDFRDPAEQGQGIDRRVRADVRSEVYDVLDWNAPQRRWPRRD